MNAPETSWTSESSLLSRTATTVYRPHRNTNRVPVTLTLENAECGVTLSMGEVFELDLDPSEWRMRIRDKEILAYEGDGMYRATSRGGTKIYATSEPMQSTGDSLTLSPKLLIEIPVTIL